MRNIVLPGPDKSIDIYHGGLRLTCETADAGDVDFVGIGSIRFNWQPSPIICFELSQVDHLVKDSIMMLIDKSSIFKNKSQLMSLASDFLPEKKIRCDIQVTGINWQDSYVELKGTPRDRVSVNYPVERACDILKIYLVNLNTYRFQSQEGDLNISLEPLDDFYNLKKLKEEGTKYVVTHCCEVIRGNGQELHAENVELIIQAFGHMFSFIRGGDCFPICFTGYKSKKATPIWGEWMMPHSSPIQEPFDNWSKSQTHFQDMFTNMIAYMRMISGET